jgi:diguanylate cyclase (GGDEF)-like protein/PAS domain S-box-containing protein
MAEMVRGPARSPERGRFTALGSSRAFLPALVWVAGFLVFLLVRPAGAPTVSLVAHAVHLVTPLAAAALAANRSTRQAKTRERRGWLFVALAGLSSGAAQVVWLVDEFGGRSVPPLASLAHVGYLAMLVFLFAAVLALTRMPPAHTARLRSLVDALVAAGAVLLISWPLTVEPLLAAGVLPRGQLAVALAYPTIDVLVAAVALRALAWSRELRRSLWFLAAGLLLFAVANHAFLYLAATGRYSTGHPVGAVWTAAHVMVALAALQPRGHSAPRRRPVVACQLAPYWPVGVAVPVVFVELSSWSGRVSLVVLSTSVLLLAITRQSLTLSLERTSRRALEDDLQGLSQELSEEQEHYESLTRGVADVVGVVDRDGNLPFVSPAVERLLGIPLHDVSRERLVELVHPDDLEQAGAAFAEARVGRAQLAQLRMRRDGQWREVEIELSAADPARGDVLLTARDVTERVHAERRLQLAERFDSLTGLPNRTSFLDRLDEAIADERARDRLAVLLLDLDGFKNVNDSLGHRLGDVLLAAAGVRIARACGEAALVARLGGDEFALLVHDANIALFADRLAQRLVAEFRMPFELDDVEVFVHASVGVVLGRHGGDGEELLKAADTAMYAAKSEGRNRSAFFNPLMAEAVREQLALRTALQRASERDELELWYQPIVGLRSGRVEGFEALMRWRSPVHGYVPPNRFIPIAEESDLITRLGLWALSEACGQLARWREAHPASREMTVSVNVSGRQLGDPRFTDQVAAVLSMCELPAHCLVLELTESLALDAHWVPQRLAALRRLGVGLAMDDFGTGYSSLGSLHQMPFDQLKLDRSFVAPLSNGSERGAQFLRSITAMASGLGMRTVAEGVETPEQLEALRAAGIDNLQGYLFARPAPADAVEEFVRDTIVLLDAR